MGRETTYPPIGAISAFFQCWLDCVFPMQCQLLCLVVYLFLFVLVMLTDVSLYNLWFQGCLSTVYKRIVPLQSPVWLYLLGGLIYFLKYYIMWGEIGLGDGQERNKDHKNKTQLHSSFSPPITPSPPQSRLRLNHLHPTPCLPPWMCLGSSMNCAFRFLSAWLDRSLRDFQGLISIASSVESEAIHLFLHLLKFGAVWVYVNMLAVPVEFLCFQWWHETKKLF